MDFFTPWKLKPLCDATRSTWDSRLLIALWLFGGEVIRDFVEAMIFGIVVGTYSSIYVAGALLLYLPFGDDAKRSDPNAVEDAAPEAVS